MQNEREIGCVAILYFYVYLLEGFMDMDCYFKIGLQWVATRGGLVRHTKKISPYRIQYRNFLYQKYIHLSYQNFRYVNITYRYRINISIYIKIPKHFRYIKNIYGISEILVFPPP